MAAIEAKEDDGPDCVTCWRLSVEAGDMKAHFGLGYTLLDNGEAHAAYDHLRFYTELAHWNAWAWSWLGRAAEELGDWPEGLRAYDYAIELEQQGGEETDAPDFRSQLWSAVQHRIYTRTHDEWVERGLIPDPYEAEGNPDAESGDDAGLVAEYERRVELARRRVEAR